MLRSPPGPSCPTTRLGTVSPGTGFRFDEVGRTVPPGHTVMYVGSVALTAVRFHATAVASAGMPNWPAWAKLQVSWAASGPVRPPVPSRVSKIRSGVIDTNPLAAEGPSTTG